MAGLMTTVCIFTLLATAMATRPLERGDAGISKFSVGSSVSFNKDEMAAEQVGINNVEHQQIEGVKECDKSMDEEECLDRRTLAAHTDYIYTQHHKSP